INRAINTETRRHRGSTEMKWLVGLDADGVILSVGVSGVRGDDVANPTEGSTTAEPESRGDDQPENARQDSPVVKLTNTRDDKTQNTRQNWIAHLATLRCGESYDERRNFVHCRETLEGDERWLSLVVEVLDIGDLAAKRAKGLLNDRVFLDYFTPQLFCA